MTALFVFDFDGVLFDTAPECLHIAFRTARDWAFGEKWRDLDAPPRDVAEQFLQHRYWVGPPWQYAVLLECIARRELPASTEAFLARARSRQAELTSFTDAYFATRTETAKDRERWLGLVVPFRPALDELARALRADRGVILSTRDGTSIRTLCEAHGLEIDARNLLPRAGQQEKWQLLLEAGAARGLSNGRLFFVDDYLHHALPAHQRGVSTFLATWGYLAPDDIATATTQGLPCLQLTNLGHAMVAHQENSK